MVARAAPDGHTLLGGFDGTFTINPHLHSRLGFVPPRDFTAAAELADVPVLVVGHPALPAHTLAEVVALARARPGELAFATGGVGTTGHLPGEWLCQSQGIRMTHMWFRGGGQAVAAIVAGRVSIMLAGITAGRPIVPDARLAGLAVPSARRSTALPEVAAMQEQGFAGMDVSCWASPKAPAQTPPEVVERLRREVGAVLAEPEIVARLREQRGTPGTTDAFLAQIAAESARWRKVIQCAGIRVEGGARDATRRPVYPARMSIRTAKAPPSPFPEAEEGAGSALGKGFVVLEALLAAEAPVSLAELAQLVGMPKASVHRLLLQLEEARLIRRDLTGKAWLQAPRLVDLSLRAVARAARMDPVHAALRRLVDEVGESVNLAVLDRGEVVYADRVECNWPLRTTFQPGSRVPIHCTASGKMFLAAMEPEQLDRIIGTGSKLAAYTGRTLTRRADLDAELARIRQDWVAVNDQEYMVGLVGVAVPVRDAEGRVLAVVAIHAPVPRLTAEAALRHVPRLRRAAKDIAAGLRA